METVLRRPASFRLRAELLEALKTRASKCNRSLNNYVESILLSAIASDNSSELTLSAIAEAKDQLQAIKEGRDRMGSVDTQSVDAMLASLGV